MLSIKCSKKKIDYKIEMLALLYRVTKDVESVNE